MRWAALKDRLQASLFVEPLIFMLVAVGAAQVTLRLDRSIDSGTADLPLGLASTVDSARAVLSTIASATITVAGIAFSIALLVLQLASTQYSPRVVQNLFRDPFNKRVVGLVVGTFTYCLVVLRSVRSPLESGGEPVIPNVSIAVAVVLGIASILGIVAFINHSAHTMDVSELLHTVTAQTTEALHQVWTDDERDGDTLSVIELPPVDPHRVCSLDSGWVGYIDRDAMLDAMPERAIVRLDVTAGDFAIRGAPLCSVWPPSLAGPDLDRAMRKCISVGRTRTMAQDPAYGVRQLVDVALRALSPGVNDPTTAVDAIHHIGAVLAAAYECHSAPSQCTGEDGRTIVDAAPETHETLTRLAFDEIRRAAAPHPRVATSLLGTMGTLLRLADDRGHVASASVLRTQAVLVLSATRDQSLLAEDVARVREVYSRTFFDRPTSQGDAQGECAATPPSTDRDEDAHVLR
jgi:uncharacterized membrane protein